MKVQWIYQKDAGFWDSWEGRFSVSPIYGGHTTPQGYELHDELRTHFVMNLIGGEKHETHIYQGMWTVKEAKAKAEEILQAERDRK